MYYGTHGALGWQGGASFSTDSGFSARGSEPAGGGSRSGSLYIPNIAQACADLWDAAMFRQYKSSGQETPMAAIEKAYLQTVGASIGDDEKLREYVRSQLRSHGYNGELSQTGKRNWPSDGNKCASDLEQMLIITESVIAEILGVQEIPKRNYNVAGSIEMARVAAQNAAIAESAYKKRIAGARSGVAMSIASARAGAETSARLYGAWKARIRRLLDVGFTQEEAEAIASEGEAATLAAIRDKLNPPFPWVWVGVGVGVVALGVVGYFVVKG